MSTRQPTKDRHLWLAPAARPDDFLRVPGLFRSWEVQQVLDAEHEFHIEGAGSASDGTPLFAVYRRELNDEDKE